MLTTPRFSLLGTLLLLSACGSTPHKPAVGAAMSPCLVHSQQSADDALYGYGRGATLAEAKQQAYADISAQLKVQVRSESIARVQKQNADISSQFEQHITSHSSANFAGLELECLDQHSNPGTVQVALRLDRRPLERKITADLAQQLTPTPARIRWQGPAAIASAPLLTRINEQLQQQGTGETALPVKLFHNRNTAQWTLQLGAHSVHLEAEQLQLLVNWQGVQKGAAQLAALSPQGELLNPQIAAETEYRLALKHPTGGYAHLLGIYENGDIDLLRSNLRLTANQTQIVPEHGGVFEAATLPEQNLTTDTLILLVTAHPLSDAALSHLNRKGDNTGVHNLVDGLEKITGDIAVVQLVVK